MQLDHLKSCRRRTNFIEFVDQTVEADIDAKQIQLSWKYYTILNYIVAIPHFYLYKTNKYCSVITKGPQLQYLQMR